MLNNQITANDLKKISATNKLFSLLQFAIILLVLFAFGATYFYNFYNVVKKDFDLQGTECIIYDVTPGYIIYSHEGGFKHHVRYLNKIGTWKTCDFNDYEIDIKAGRNICPE